MRSRDLAIFLGNLWHDAESRMESFLKETGASVPESRIQLRRGRPEDVSSRSPGSFGAELLIPGTVARAGLLLVGNTAERILRRAECSILAVKPADFVSPITL